MHLRQWKRRDFITLIGGAAAWPLAARAQQGGGMRRIGKLIGYAESDSDARAWYAAFQEELQKLGWVDGRNIRFDIRWVLFAIDPSWKPSLPHKQVTQMVALS